MLSLPPAHRAPDEHHHVALERHVHSSKRKFLLFRCTGLKRPYTNRPHTNLWSAGFRTIGAPDGAATARVCKEYIDSGIKHETGAADKARRESLPWLQDLLLPLLAGPPEPLTGTQPPEQLADPDSEFVCVGGVRLHFKQVAAGQVPAGGQPGATLLLVHGFNGSLFNWRLVMSDIAEQVAQHCGSCRVIAFDRPPFGLSQRPLQWPEGEEGPYTVAAGARLGVGLLRALGSGPALVVGHSQGAAVAVEMAARWPEAVAGLALVAPAVLTSPRGFLGHSDLGQLLRLAATRALLAADGPGLQYVRRLIHKRRDEVLSGRMGIYYDESALDEQTLAGYLQPLESHDWDRGFLLMSRSLAVAGPPPDLRALPQPVLVLQGAQDTTTPSSLASAIAAQLQARPGVATRYVELQRCGHIPMEELPGSCAQQLASFACSDIVSWHGALEGARSDALCM